MTRCGFVVADIASSKVGVPHFTPLPWAPCCDARAHPRPHRGSWDPKNPVTPTAPHPNPGPPSWSRLSREVLEPDIGRKNGVGVDVRVITVLLRCVAAT